MPRQRDPQRMGDHRSPPPRRRVLPWILISVAAGAAILVVASLGLSAVGSGPGTARTAAIRPSASPQAREWQAVSTQHNALGTWSYGNSFIVAADTEVTSYNGRTGKVLWQTKAPVVRTGATVFCGASRTISGATAVLGIGVVTDSAAAASDCRSVVSLNVATGKLGWVAQVPDAAQSKIYANSIQNSPALAHKGLIVAIAGQHAVVGWQGIIASFSVVNGARQWSRVVGPDTQFHSSAPDITGNVINDIAVSGSDIYVSVTGIFPAQLQMVRMSAATGRPLRVVNLPGKMTRITKPAGATIVSTAPLTVVAEEPLPTQSASVVVLGPGLHITHVINAGPQIAGQGATIGKTLNASPLGVGNNEARQEDPLLIGRGLLVGATLAPGHGGGNPLVGIDYRTGETRWATAVRGSDIIYPVAIAGPIVEVIGVSQGGQGNPVIMKFSLATGKLLFVGRPRSLGAAPMADVLQYYHFTAAGGVVYGVDWAQTSVTQGGVPAVFSLR
jgi:outer membrane protein assembly factor BamB